MNFSTQSTTGMSAKEYVCGIDLPDITNLRIPRSYPYHNQNSKELWGARLTAMTEARKLADSKRQRKSFEDAETRSNLRKNNKGPQRYEVGQEIWYKNPEVDRNGAKVKTTWAEGHISKKAETDSSYWVQPKTGKAIKRMVQDLQKRVQLVQRTITSGKVIEKKVDGEVESAPSRRSQDDLDGKYESRVISKRKNRTDDQDVRPP